MKIKYRVANGKTIEVEVTEEQAEVIVKTVREAENNDTKHRLRKAHEASLDYLSEEYNWEPTDSSPTPDEILEEREKQTELAEQKEHLKEAIASLNAKQRELVQLHFYDGKSTRQIAAIFGVHHSCIAKQILTITKTLKKIL